MAARIEVAGPLPGAAFGATVRLSRPVGEELPERLPQALADAGGLLLLPGLGEISVDPQILVRLSSLFGPHVHDYRTMVNQMCMVHPTVPEIFLVSNMLPGGRPPPEAMPGADGAFPVQYPQRKGWHTDMSFRVHSPDVSLFYGEMARGSGQTIFASGTLAYETLPAHLREKVETLRGLHCKPGTGRDRRDAEDGKPAPFVQPHERSVPQPVVRIHPVTGKKALFLCERAQMDWFEGPFIGMEPGPYGDGARLLDELMVHYTRPEFIYVHEWTQGDLLVWDNRCLIHTGAWYDAVREQRMMWRTTVAPIQATSMA